jgi:uncharacterized protein
MNIAIITGASSGLGVKFLDAITRKYPTLDEYWIIARRTERLEALAKKYEPKKIVSIEADLSDEKAYVKIADKLKKEQPLIKVLINNAGYEKSGAFSSMQEKDILSMIAVNIKGMTMMQRICLPYMQTGSFSIITCSVSAFSPVPNQAIYAASKKYVYYFGKALREELLAKKINVLLLCPGNMDTEMNPKGKGRQSQKINGLPFLDMEKLTMKALELAQKGRGVYTPGWFYKGYRVVSKILPSAWMLKITGRFY